MIVQMAGVVLMNHSNLKASGLMDSALNVSNMVQVKRLPQRRAYENEEPWFGYYWAPTSVLGYI